MKRLFGLFSKGQGPPPSPSGGASLPCVGAASELREKELGKLHRAAASGDLARVRRPWWLRRLGIDRRDKAKRTPLHLACANGHSEVVSYLVGNKCKLDPRDNFKRSPLMKAVQCQQEECVAILLAHGADPNLADVNGSTALHLAAIAPNTSLAGQLLEHNARIDARNEMGYTPLALAVSKHHEEMVEFLLKKGADVHARDQSERTPLMLAASAGDMSVIEVLLRYGADLSQEDILGWTAEDYARTSGHARVSQHLVDSAVGEKAGEASAGGAKGVPALSTPPGAGAAGFALGACALASGGVTSAAGVEREEDSDSPWDSESLHSLTSCLSAEAAVKWQVSANERGKRARHKAAATQTDLQYDGQAMAGELLEEVADALEKQSLPEALLEVTKLCCSELKEGKLQLQEELDRVKAKLQESEEQRVQSERCVQDLKTALENKQREVVASSQQLQGLLGASSGAVSLKDLEERVGRLELANASLEGRAQQHNDSLAVLQKELHGSASMQKQNVLSVTAKDPRSTWEEELKSRSQLEDRLAQLEREKAELLEQCETERKEAKALIELKRLVEVRLDQAMKRNIELQKECNRFKKLLKTAMKKLKVQEMRESESQFGSQGEMKNRYSEMVNEVTRLRTKVGELSRQLEIESKKSMQLEARNQDLGEELSSMRWNREKLEKSECQLKEEVSNLKHRLETNVVDHNQIEQYKKETEERAGQELRQKLQEVNLFLQTQAASQDRLEQIRASHHASLRNQLKHRIRDLESELDKIKNTQQDNIFQKESTQAEVGKYKELYLEEVKIRRCLANKLERANERLAEANAKLLNERHRSRSLIASSIVSGGGLTASPILYSTQLGHLGNNLALNRSLSLGGSFVSPTGNALSSRNRVEAYVAKVWRELDEKITKELEQATAELETGSAGAFPMVSTDGSSKNVNADQDPLSRAIQEYRDVLTKNYLI